MEQHLHIISFDIPFPATYGGVIDVFYKIKTLAGAGVRIHLHCFSVKPRKEKTLEDLCASVRYYPRNEKLNTHFSLKPFIVNSRISDELLQDLTADNYPILFEGLHTCFFLDHPALKNRLKIYRESNIEHQYYYHLSAAEKNLLKKTFFLFESFRLRLFQRQLRNADIMLVVSQEDRKYLMQKFPGKKIHFMPSFHNEDEISIQEGRGGYVLYHGKLSVPENEQSALYLVNEVWEPAMPELIIAGMNPGARLLDACSNKANIRIQANPCEPEMTELIRNAHIHLLLTFQPTGLKLKLLNALYNGRFCLVNSHMVAGTSLANLCTISDHIPDIRRNVQHLWEQDFTAKMFSERIIQLKSEYSNKKNCNELLNFINLLHEKDISPG